MLLTLGFFGLLGECTPLWAQNPLPDISGTWQVDTPDGPENFIVRADSSASFGEETVRWRLAQDTLYILFGEEWVGYHFRLKGKEMTLSGGDLEEPVVLRRVGPVVEPSGSRSGESPLLGSANHYREVSAVSTSYDELE